MHVQQYQALSVTRHTNITFFSGSQDLSEGGGKRKEKKHALKANVH